MPDLRIDLVFIWLATKLQRVLAKPTSTTATRGASVGVNRRMSATSLSPQLQLCPVQPVMKFAVSVDYVPGARPFELGETCRR